MKVYALLANGRYVSSPVTRTTDNVGLAAVMTIEQNSAHDVQAYLQGIHGQRATIYQWETRHES